MNILYLLLQAEQVVENAAQQVITNPQTADAAQAAGTAAQGAKTPGSQASMWILLIAIFVIMWLFMIRPQRKAEKEQRAFLNAITRGTKVITAGGIYGTVAEVKENMLVIEVDDGVKIRVNKNQVQKDPADTTIPAAEKKGAKKADAEVKEK